MTEDEAKTKLCFKAATFGASQQLADGPGPSCIASSCMAWRWDGSNITNPTQPKSDLVWSNRTYGHCGLAGGVELARASGID